MWRSGLNRGQTCFIGLLICLQLSSCAILRNFHLLSVGATPLNEPDETIRFEIKGDMIYIKAKINQMPQEYNFFLDTGSQCTTINQKLAEELKLAKMKDIKVISPDGNGKAYLTQLHYLSVGGVTIRECAANVTDLSDFESHEGFKIDGILGCNFLRFFAVTIDYEQRKLILSSEAHFPISHAEPVVMHFNQNVFGGIPVINCLGNCDIPLIGIIDTGSPTTVVNLNLYKLEKELFTAARKIRGQIGGGIFKAFDRTMYLQMGRLKLGTIVLEKIPVVGIEFDDGLANDLVIGKDILQKYIFTIDYLKSKLILLPRREKIDQHEQFLVGATFKKDEGNRTVVCAIIESSPADKNGLSIGDEVLEINGKPSREYSTLDLNKWAYKDIDYHIKIKKHGVTKEIVLRKVDLFL